MKCKHYEIVTRPEFLKEKVGDTIRRYSTIKRYAYILHDKDDTAAHYHIYLNFGRVTVSYDTVAKWFMVPITHVSSLGLTGLSSGNYFLYLVGYQPRQERKFRYSPNKVKANFDFNKEVLKNILF